MPTTKHGGARRGATSREYWVWNNMMKRCTKPRDPRHKWYGGRGITVWARWHNYAVFVRDIRRLIGAHPGVGWSLDRIRGTEGYKPANVRWATKTTQARNRAYCRVDSTIATEIRKRYARGDVKQSDLAAEFGLAQSHISRITRGEAWV